MLVVDGVSCLVALTHPFECLKLIRTLKWVSHLIPDWVVFENHPFGDCVTAIYQIPRCDGFAVWLYERESYVPNQGQRHQRHLLEVFLGG